MRSKLSSELIEDVERFCPKFIRFVFFLCRASDFVTWQEYPRARANHHTVDRIQPAKFRQVLESQGYLAWLFGELQTGHSH